MIKAVIFDMDGLLIDSEPFWRKAHVAGCKENHIEITEEEVRKVAGLKTDEIVQKWISHSTKDVSFEVLKQCILDNVINLISSKGELMPGALKLTLSLIENNYSLAIASSASQKVIETVIKKFKLEDAFKMILSAEFEEYGKPHPGIFIHTAQKLSLDPKECLVLEDSFNGVLAAKSAQMKCFAVPEKIALQEPKFIIADKIFASLEEIDIEVIKNL